MRYEIHEGPFSLFDPDHHFVNIVVKFKKFRYAFQVSERVVGRKILQDSRGLLSFLKPLVETEIVPFIDKFGKENRQLLLSKRTTGGFAFSVLSTEPSFDIIEPNNRKHTPNPVHNFFWDPPLWVGVDVFKEDQLGKLKCEELVFDRILPSTKIEVAVTRDAQFFFDFSEYRVARKSPRIWHLDESHGAQQSKISKDLKVQKFQRQIKNCYIGLVCSGQRIQRRYSPVMFCEGKHIRSSSRILGPDGGPAEASRWGEVRKIQDSRDPNVLYNCTALMSRNTFGPILLTSLGIAADQLDQLLSRDDGLKLFDKVTLWHTAWVEISKGQYSSALLKAWLIIESIVNDAWAGYLTTHERLILDERKRPSQFMPEGRRERLRRLQAASQIDLLSLVGVIPDWLLEDTHAVRSMRNGYVHQLQEVESEDAQRALAVCESFIDLFDEFVVRSGCRPWRREDILSWREYADAELYPPDEAIEA